MEFPLIAEFALAPILVQAGFVSPVAPIIAILPAVAFVAEMVIIFAVIMTLIRALNGNIFRATVKDVIRPIIYVVLINVLLAKKDALRQPRIKYVHKRPILAGDGALLRTVILEKAA